MNNKQIVTFAVVAGIAVVAYLAWKKSKAASPVVTPPNSNGGATTPAGSDSVIGGVIDIATDAWNDLSGLFGNQS